MVKYRFRVRLRQFHATDLPGKDLDPFVKVNFDSFKKFNTNAVSGNNPKWYDAAVSLASPLCATDRHM